MNSVGGVLPRGGGRIIDGGMGGLRDLNQPSFLTTGLGAPSHRAESKRYVTRALLAW